MMIWNLLKTIRTIAHSRVKKTKTNALVEYRREICKNCEYNSLNLKYIPLLKQMIKKLSDFYSWITGNAEVDVLGNCTACLSCSIYYLSRDEDECHDPEKDRWKSVYIPNSAKKEIKK